MSVHIIDDGQRRARPHSAGAAIGADRRKYEFKQGHREMSIGSLVQTFKFEDLPFAARRKLAPDFCCFGAATVRSLAQPHPFHFCLMGTDTAPPGARHAAHSFRQACAV